MAQSSQATGGLGSIPALSASVMSTQFGGQRRPIGRKEFGIWQSWTWAEDRIRKSRRFALGLINLGVARGRFRRHHWPQPPLFLLGDGRCAVQSGAVPVPMYHDSRRRRDGLCVGSLRREIRRCGRSGTGRQDHRRCRKSLHQFEHTIYIDPRGMRKYDHHKLHEYSATFRTQGRAAYMMSSSPTCKNAAPS